MSRQPVQSAAASCHAAVSNPFIERRTLCAMSEQWHGPSVVVVSTTPIAGGYRVVCRFSEPYGKPIAPGGLYTAPHLGQESFAVHRVVACSGDEVTFESFGERGGEPPSAGATFFYRGWWVEAAMAAVLDTSATWERRTYPDDGNHDHCLFTWETIASYAAEKSGYWSERHGCVTEQAYTDFILNDIYRLPEQHGA